MPTQNNNGTDICPTYAQHNGNNGDMHEAGKGIEGYELANEQNRIQNQRNQYDANIPDRHFGLRLAPQQRNRHLRYDQ